MAVFGGGGGSSRRRYGAPRTPRAYKPSIPRSIAAPVRPYRSAPKTTRKYPQTPMAKPRPNKTYAPKSRSYGDSNRTPKSQPRRSSSHSPHSQPRRAAPKPSHSHSQPRSAPKPAHTPHSQSSSSGEGNYSSGGIGATSAGTLSAIEPAAIAPPPPAPPTEEAYLGADTTYLSQEAALKKALEDYAAQKLNSTTQYGVEHGARINELGLGRKQGVSDNENDFASRGLLQSGLFGNAQSELNAGFDRRGADLERAKSTWMQDSEQQYGNFKSEQGLTKDRARADALARRASQYSLG